MKAIAYYRVSSKSQKENTSLENQQKQVHAYAASHGIEIIAEFQDVASGGNTERPGLRAALAYLEQHLGEVDAFMVSKYDRGHRNLKETLIFVDDLAKKGIAYISVTQNIDTSTPQGKLFFQMVCSFAEFEKSIIKERCKDGRKAKAAKKETPGGRPPVGYNRSWGIVEAEAKVVAELFSAYLRLGSLAKVAKYAQEQGFPGLTKSVLSPTSICGILRNRAYLGEYRYDGRKEQHGVCWKKHHAPIVSSVAFGKVQAMLDRNNRKCKVA